MKTIAVDLDDTLNDFTRTLQTARFSYDPAYNISPETFDRYLEKIRRGESDANELLSTEYSYFCYRIHAECYRLAPALPGAAEFMRWLRENRWRIVILTHRDLRRSNEATRRWLRENEIPFDHLFLALHKLAFCKAWKVQCLVDDHPMNLAPSDDPHEVELFYPITSQHERLPIQQGRGFRNFDELKQWIPNQDS
jgi:5'(3')-deoxyribonucleotidase